MGRRNTNFHILNHDNEKAIFNNRVTNRGYHDRQRPIPKSGQNQKTQKQKTMLIKTRISHNSFVEIQIEIGNTKITEDLERSVNGKWIVPESDIEQFLTIANDCSRFNGVADVDFVKMVADAFLSDVEKEEFANRLLNG